ncbi:1-deoxy-D-xylulose 5-phosphate reductoisomerase, partial [Achromatium sp. WMS1]
VLHPQSFIHSLVQYIDGSVLAQLGYPDMRTPIAHALGWPKRITSGVAELDLSRIAPLEFRNPEKERFPCLWLAAAAIKEGGTAPVILNAANEVAVSAFLGRNIKFTDIPDVIEAVIDTLPSEAVEGIDMLLETDARARAAAQQYMRKECS